MRRWADAWRFVDLKLGQPFPIGKRGADAWGLRATRPRSTRPQPALPEIRRQGVGLLGGRMRRRRCESTRHTPEIARRIDAERNHFWFHVRQSDNPALTESLLPGRQGCTPDDGP